MKKTLKRLTLLVLAFLMLFFLCSCFDLDDLREKHAKLQEDGSIVLGGQVYKKIYTTDNFDLLGRDTTTLTLTEADIPLLLAETVGSHAYLDRSGRFISYYQYPNSYMSTTSSIGFYRYYCREDYYGEVIRSIANEDREYHCCLVMSNNDYDEYLYFLTDEETEAIMDAIAFCTTPENTPSADHLSYSGYDYFASFESRSADGLLKDPYFFEYTYLCYSAEEDTYYMLFKYTDGGLALGVVGSEFVELFDEFRAKAENLE